MKGHSHVMNNSFECGPFLKHTGSDSYTPFSLPIGKMPSESRHSIVAAPPPPPTLMCALIASLGLSQLSSLSLHHNSRFHSSHLLFSSSLTFMVSFLHSFSCLPSSLPPFTMNPSSRFDSSHSVSARNCAL